MYQEVNGDNVLLGRGKVYLDRFVAGTTTKTGERFLGNCSVFEITPTSEDIKKYSSADAAAQLICSDVLRNTLALRVTGDEFDPDNLAMALFGDTANFTQSADNITDEVITCKLQGVYYALANRGPGITNVVVTGPSGTPTYDLTDDYLVDAAEGRIYIVPGGDIADAGDENIEVDYDCTALDLERVRGMNQTTVKGFVRFVGDPARGPKYTVEVWRASVHADGAIGLIGDDYAAWNMIGDIEADAVNHPNEPHFRAIKVA